MKCLKCGGQLKRSPKVGSCGWMPGNYLFVCTECYDVFEANEIGETLRESYPELCEGDEEELFWEEYDYREERCSLEMGDMIHELAKKNYVLLNETFLEYYELSLEEFKEHFTCMANNMLPNEDRSDRAFKIEQYSEFTYIIKDKVFEPTRSPLYWYGGKGNMKQHIIEYISQARHTHYISVFGGSACVELAKEPSSIETFNDLNSGVTNFFAVLRDEDSTIRLLELLDATPYSLDEFKYCRDNWMTEENPVEKARMFFVATNQAFNANGGWKTTKNEHGKGKARTVAKWNAKKALIIPAQERLKSMQIDNRDYRKIFELYDTEDSFFFCDPPYVPETRSQKKSYKYEMSVEDHEEMVDTLIQAKGKVLLCGYDNPTYNRLTEYGWRKELLGEFAKASGHRKDFATKAQEYIWLNYNEKGERIANRVELNELSRNSVQQMTLSI